MHKTIIVVAALALGGCDLGPRKINEKLVCNGNDAGWGSFELTPTKEQVDDWGEAFSAQGNCDAELKDSIIVSPAVALRAGGNTKLVFVGGRVEGNPAVDLSGNATVEFKGTQVVGEIKTAGNAKVLGLDAPVKPDPPQS